MVSQQRPRVDLHILVTDAAEEAHSMRASPSTRRRAIRRPRGWGTCRFP